MSSEELELDFWSSSRLETLSNCIHIHSKAPSAKHPLPLPSMEDELFWTKAASAVGVTDPHELALCCQDEFNLRDLTDLGHGLFISDLSGSESVAPHERHATCNL